MVKSISTHGRYSIGALAARSGVKVETIRYYETVGIMPRPARSAAGYRRYTHDDLQRLTFIRRGRQLAFSLEALRDLLRLIDGHSHTCAEGRTLALAHLADIRGKLADLKRLEGAVADIAARCTGEPVPDCALIEALSTPEEREDFQPPVARCGDPLRLSHNK
jgi:MerR family transcriptional regulator, mercuric resistance operon regulatory protein